MVLDFETTDKVFVFPGIGVKPCGRERDFYLKYTDVMAPFLQQGSVVTGIDLAASLVHDIIFENEQFVREVFAYSFSCGMYKVLEQKGLNPSLMAGHSLGIYAALVCSGVTSFEEGLTIIKTANKLGRKYCGRGAFGVGVIIGLEPGMVFDYIEQSGYQSINLANLNSPSSGVYVGLSEEITGLLQWADLEDAMKTIRLRIDIPFHSPKFMEKATADLLVFLQSCSWHKPRCPILSSLDHSLISDPGELMEMTAANLSSTIDWPGVMARLVQMGVQEVIECGAGVSLTQHGRFIESSPRHFNLKNMRRRLRY